MALEEAKRKVMSSGCRNSTLQERNINIVHDGVFCKEETLFLELGWHHELIVPWRLALFLFYKDTHATTERKTLWNLVNLVDSLSKEKY